MFLRLFIERDCGRNGSGVDGHEGAAVENAGQVGPVVLVLFSDSSLLQGLAVLEGIESNLHAVGNVAGGEL